MKIRNLIAHNGLRSITALLAIVVLAGCSDSKTNAVDAANEESATPADTRDGPFDIVNDVIPNAAYGTQRFSVPAETNWVNSGLYLNVGETATITAEGSWVLNETELGPEGQETLGSERGCAYGSLVARSGLRYQDDITCVGTGATFTAARSDIVYLGMILSTDLGESYESRLAASGSVSVSVSSNGNTVPSVRASEFQQFDLSEVNSGWIEVLGEHVIITTTSEQATIDRATVVASINTLDEIYIQQLKLRGIAPFNAQRIRFFADDLSGFYMLAGNPIRTDPSLLSGNANRRILRASELQTDIWGFSHELGHTFSFANGLWLYQVLNLESWPNIFTLYSLTNLQRLEGQPNADSYCENKTDYLTGGDYATLRDDPFLQLCFLMEFTDQYGWAFWERFFASLNVLRNEDVAYDGSDASVWRFVRDQFSLAAGEDVTATFNLWSVPLQ